jgi:hypothetical protein
VYIQRTRCFLVVSKAHSGDGTRLEAHFAFFDCGSTARAILTIIFSSLYQVKLSNSQNAGKWE